jgi:hypothetical protein
MHARHPGKRQGRPLAGALLAGTLLAGALLAATLERTPARGPRPGLAGGGRMAALPRTVLWSWERADDLRGLDAEAAGVAFLACTVYLRGERVGVRPRLASLRHAPAAALIAVARIESDRRQRPALSAAQRAGAVAAIARLAGIGGVRAVQVDFDATASERAFYTALLHELRAALPEATGLSMTALASWCLYDDWLDELPVDEIVPMLFRLGPEQGAVVGRLEAGGDLLCHRCRGSLGTSTDEPVRFRPPGRRHYVFHPRAWSERDVRALLLQEAQP